MNYHTSEETGIMDALMALNTKDKEVLILYYIEGYSCREIASMLKVTENAIKKKLERARKRLKEKYESE
ncbi:MAG: RNA polymerase sigma factor [Ruminococcus sp.]